MRTRESGLPCPDLLSFPALITMGPVIFYSADLILSHTVVGWQIYFFTTEQDHVYIFDACYRQWTAVDVYSRGCNGRLSFGEPVVPISDSAWAAIGSCHFVSPVNTFDLKAHFGLVGRDV
ncbi:hypothetical protein RHMOL_Rhmol03G0197900 [Rhododendron molle]|uniref:Uncharacterized protein n=1 Tax=Rhododendron molle TaxID=49168 RepID=A0ACC0PGN1_RHOML|nr:hypothetical protein RHMOL_Rhmol03G0197900 [Rhododendron molle]